MIQKLPLTTLERILVLTDNGIEEQGTHKELLELNGVYANLYNMQLRIEDIHEERI